jgi:VIT1/CCC1 family predicted Fe2+/Mn2+ transporter
MSHGEPHRLSRAGFLRAAVLGANDGIISTASLITGICSSGAGSDQILTAAIAGLVAGAMSMAAGEYVSVSSQSDIETADIEREKKELKESPDLELEELQNIYIGRGLEKELAFEVAKQLTKHNALHSHMRDELGLIDVHQARPFQAAWTSALTFSLGAFFPVIIVTFIPKENLIFIETAFTLILLFFMGGIAAKVGGSNFFKGAMRVCFWGALAMGFTTLIGTLFKVNI